MPTEYLESVTDAATNYTFQTVTKDADGEFNITVFLAGMIVILWLRFIMMLQLTKRFGPMLRIIIVMVGDVLTFLFVWILVLMCLSAAASLLFGSLDEYSEFFNVFIIEFDTGIGNYDFAPFDNLDLGPKIGKGFIILSAIINLVIMLNFIIAILADTYSNLSQNRLGLYYDGIIARIPIYEDDDRYGGLIIGTPPFNILAFIMIPFYVFVKDEDTLRRGNNVFSMILYAPLALVFTAIYMTCSLALVPFAYLAATMKKMKLLFLSKTTYSDEDLEINTPTAGEFGMFVLLGLPILICAWAKDTV